MSKPAHSTEMPLQLYISISAKQNGYEVQVAPKDRPGHSVESKYYVAGNVTELLSLVKELSTKGELK